MSGNGRRSDKPRSREFVCPMCRKVFRYDETDEEKKKAFPFCCARCKMADLDMWFTEDYRISRSAHPDDLEEEEAKGE
jgi:endogenous inhibitor of DNA gyrase (YacG/DUF329 family)